MIIHTLSSFPFHRPVLALAVALVCATGRVSATTISVSGGCTLVNAINNANADADTDGSQVGCPAGKGADTIVLTAGKMYTLTKAFDGDNGLPSISSTITISGNGATLQRSRIEGTPRFRLLHIADTGNLTIEQLKLKNGHVFNEGGGIHNQGNLALVDSIVSGNTAIRQDSDCWGYVFFCDGNGGGISNGSGTLKLYNSTVVDNSSGIRGGGIYNSNGEVISTNSVVSRNRSSYGGGVFNAQGTLSSAQTRFDSNTAEVKRRSIVGPSGYQYYLGAQGGGIFNGGSAITKGVEDTIVNNKAINKWGGDYFQGGGSFGGGGVFNSGIMQLTNITFRNNQSYSVIVLNGFEELGGGGLFNNGNLTLTHSTLSLNKAGNNKGGGVSNQSTMTLRNSLIADSISGGDCVSSGGVTMNGVNLIEDGSCGALLSGDPKLMVLLLYNGGLTPTQALRATSPAIDAAGSDFCVGTDQRGVARPQPKAGKCDIGAFERISTTPSSVSALVQFFDANVTNGDITGTGEGAMAIAKLHAFRNQLLTAGDYKGRNLKTKACDQLVSTFKRIDPDNKPDAGDYVTGSNADTLAGKVTALGNGWGCHG